MQAQHWQVQDIFEGIESMLASNFESVPLRPSVLDGPWNEFEERNRKGSGGRISRADDSGRAGSQNFKKALRLRRSSNFNMDETNSLAGH
jgi:hypothetical protein